jgi:excisionase family DNA binding protein
MSHHIESLLSVREVCRILSISRSTLYQLVHKGQLVPPLKVGGRSKWRRADLDRIIYGKRGLRKPKRPGEGAA